MFEELKKEIKNIIKKSYDKEIYPDSNNKNIGIYMIYIDNFDDDKILPIYIGQTGCGKNRNFQNRYKEHLLEIMALNRLRYGYYKDKLLTACYEGHYKACKIFKYMVEHNCTLKDFHMIVLEEIKYKSETDKLKILLEKLEKIKTGTNELKELLEKKEKEYISKYLPTFFGFNQVNTVTEGIKENKYKIKQSNELGFSEKLLEYALEDSENFIKYFGFGYTKFNYYHSYLSYINLFESVKDNRKIFYKLEEKNNILRSKHYDENKFKKYREELPILQNKREIIINNLYNCKKQFEESYEAKVKEYCTNNNISIQHKYKDIIDMLISQNEEHNNKFKNYLKRKQINVNILDILNKDCEFVKLSNKYVKYQKSYFELYEKIKEYEYAEITDDLLRILPRREYDLFPLKDRYQEIKFDDLEDNTLIINFEFSNSGIPNGWDFCVPNLIKMDYKLNVNNKIIEKKNIFIKNKEDKNYQINYYIKEESYNRTPFNVKNFFYYISTTMEYHNGINEYTLQDKEKVDFKSVLDEINLLINKKTKVKVEVRDKLKNICKEYICNYYSSENILKNKILDLK